MKSIFIEQLRGILPLEQVLVGEPMSKHTTFRIGGNADVFVSTTMEQLPDIIKIAKNNHVPITIIGNGSNLLVGDKGIRGLVVSFGKEAEVLSVEGTKMTIGAGCLLSKAAAEAARRGLSGLEFASGIPGSLGGAIVMNAGAYGGEMKDIIKTVTVLTPDGEELVLGNEELELGYRTSIIAKKGYIVLEAVVSLEKGNREAIKARMDELKVQRTTKQPLEYPSAGSTFK